MDKREDDSAGSNRPRTFLQLLERAGALAPAVEADPPDLALTIQSNHNLAHVRLATKPDDTPLAPLAARLITLRPQHAFSVVLSSP